MFLQSPLLQIAYKNLESVCDQPLYYSFNTLYSLDSELKECNVCPHILSELYRAPRGEENIVENNIKLNWEIQARLSFFFSFSGLVKSQKLQGPGTSP